MYRQAAVELGVDPAASFYVGDKLSDLLPARALGGKGILVRTGYGVAAERSLPGEFVVAADLVAATELILGNGTGRGPAG